MKCSVKELETALDKLVLDSPGILRYELFESKLKGATVYNVVDLSNQPVYRFYVSESSDLVCAKSAIGLNEGQALIENLVRGAR